MHLCNHATCPKCFYLGSLYLACAEWLEALADAMIFVSVVFVFFCVCFFFQKMQKYSQCERCEFLKLCTKHDQGRLQFVSRSIDSFYCIDYQVYCYKVEDVNLFSLFTSVSGAISLGGATIAVVLSRTKEIMWSLFHYCQVLLYNENI